MSGVIMLHVKKYPIFIIVILVVIVTGLILSLASKDDEGGGFLAGATVERYGVLQRSSTSGDMRFNYYDIQQKKVLDTFDGHPWFFALKEEDMTDEYLQYLQENKGAVFKIIGKKLADDCDYYGDGRCLENIAVEKIEVAK